MFPNMRRSDRQTTEQRAYEILNNGTDGVFSTISEIGYPYSVPVNYVAIDNKIYLHSATKGHKIRNIEKNNKVCFTVISKNEIIQSKFSTDFESVIVFGKAKLIKPNKDILMALIHKYSFNFIEKGKAYVDHSYLDTQLIEIEIEYITGKSRKKQ